jgi:hypothetical protein
MPEILGGGAPNISKPRGLGPTAQTETLGRHKATFVWHGNQPNRWIGSGEFEKIVESWNGFDGCVCDVHDGRLRLDLGRGRKDAPLIFLSTDQKHPQLGNGLLAELILPIYDDWTSTGMMAIGRNLAESMWTDIPQFGCWHPRTHADKRVCPCFALFIPNALYGPGIASMAVLWLYQRFALVFWGVHPTTG